MSQLGMGKGSIIAVEIQSTQQLYSCYMPFLEGGGLFLPTKKTYKMGTNLLVRLKLLKENTMLPVAGRVAWIALSNVQGGQKQGVGIRFTDTDGSMRQKMEDMLMSYKEKGVATFTL